MFAGTAQVFQKHGTDGKPAEVFYQLNHPNQYNPTYLMNASFEPPQPMIIPEHVHLQTPPSGETVFGTNLTPKYSTVDPHLDLFWESMAGCIRSEKLFVTWPFCQHNQKVLLECSRDKYAFARNAPRFCAPLVGIVDETWACRFHAGTIHATLTIKEGALAGWNWITASNYAIAFRILDYELNVNIEVNWRGVFQMVVDQLESSLHLNHRHVSKDVTLGWMKIGDRLSSKGPDHLLERIYVLIAEYAKRFYETESELDGFLTKYLPDSVTQKKGSGRRNPRRV